jgi:hypothetical protein
MASNGVTLIQSFMKTCQVVKNLNKYKEAHTLCSEIS